MLTPRTVAETLRPIIEGRVVCDLGAAEGDFLQDCREFGASNVIGVENDGNKVNIMKLKGIDTLEADMFSGDFKLPEADIYYNFMYSTTVQKVSDLIPSGKTLILGYLERKFNEGAMPSWVKEYPIRIDIPFKPTPDDHSELFISKTPPNKLYWRCAIIIK